jgi:HPt (histidine-containing phosphotransfer) domain-containing protein
MGFIPGHSFGGLFQQGSFYNEQVKGDPAKEDPFRKVVIDESFADLIPWFLDNRNTDVEKVTGFLAIQNFEAIKKMGHTWKGTCPSYGFEGLGLAGQALERAAQEQSQEAIQEILDWVRRHLSEIEIINKK